MRRALGLGLTILILKFLLSEVFVAGESLLVNMLNTANVVFSNASNSLESGFDLDSVVPR
ncbi:MAG TPA: hypothetical protein VJB58_00090 [Candidatus Paceibacterota bacterium]